MKNALIREKWLLFPDLMFKFVFNIANNCLIVRLSNSLFDYL